MDDPSIMRHNKRLCQRKPIPPQRTSITYEHSHHPTMDSQVSSTSQTTDFINNAPHSLMDICIKFIALHINFIDSLIGFPEIVGKKLFDKAVQEKQFLQFNPTSIHGLKLFSDAYGSELLSCLNADSCYLSINELLSYSFVFVYLESLNLASCKLGDDHEVLQHMDQLKW